jgi:hypothetical protein
MEVITYLYDGTQQSCCKVTIAVTVGQISYHGIAFANVPLYKTRQVSIGKKSLHIFLFYCYLAKNGILNGLN